MINVSPLYYWCHKVIPLVYDDSLSYYELICKVAQKINELIANNAELPKYIKDEITEALKDTDAIREIVEEILSDNNIVLKTDLTSNDIDINTMYTQYYSKTSTSYKVLESITPVSDGYVGVYTFTNHFVMRKLNKDFEVVGSQTPAYLGHGNDCCSDGQTRVYVQGRYSSDGVVHDHGLIRVFSYPDLTELDPWEAKYGGSPVNIDSFCYDRENKMFYVIYRNHVYQYANDGHYSFVRTFDIDDVWVENDDQYAATARQGSLFYNGMICRFYSYPNMIAFYDVEDGHLVKVYTIPYKSEVGNALTELECGVFDGDELYVSSFQRDNDQGFSTNENCGAWNTILRINFWKNVPKGYYQKANEFKSLYIYVDGSTTNNRHYGTLKYPYRTLSEAMSTLHSAVAVEQPIEIVCRVGTNVGVMRGESFPPFRLNKYSLSDDTATTFEIEGIAVNYSTFQIYNAVIRNNNAIHDGELQLPHTAYLRFCNAYFGYCTFNPPTDNAYYTINNVSGTLTLRQCDLTAAEDGYCIYNNTEATLIEDNNTFHGATIRNGAGAVFNRTGKISAITSKVESLMMPVKRIVIFNPTNPVTSEDTYALGVDADLSSLTLKRSCIISLKHNTAITEYTCHTGTGNDTFVHPTAFSLTLAGSAQMHTINCHIDWTNNELVISKNRTVDLLTGEVYDIEDDNIPSGILFAGIQRIELC